MKKKLALFLSAMVLMTVAFISCEKEKDPPTAKITFTVNDYSVTFTAEAKNTATYLWDFGDGNTSTDISPVHVYDMSGSFTVTLTVKGEGGEGTTTKDVQILPSVEEMLTGGPDAVNGKTWVLSRGYTSGVNGGGVINNDMWVMLPTKESVLDTIGMGQEYLNEFTFHNDGTYEIDLKNDTAITATLFGIFGGEVTLYTFGNNELGLNLSSYTVPENATWNLHTEDLVIDANTAPLDTVVPATHSEITISGKKWVSLSEGAYFGILDFPTTRQFIIKEITPDKMDVALFICAYWADPTGSGSIPNLLYHLTFIPKE